MVTSDPDRSGTASDGVVAVLDPLWRALAGYRVLALIFAAGLLVTGYREYRAPLLGAGVLVGMAVWTALSTLCYLRPSMPPGRGRTAVADLLVTLAGVLSTLAVETPGQIHGGEPILTTVWSAGPAIALALAYGAPSGIGGALLVQAAVVLVRGRLGIAEFTDLLLIVAATASIGHAGTVLRASVRRLRDAVALRAAVHERERLARTIHDGVLQVLSRVARRGAELGGPAAELGELAGEQEVALRTLVNAGPPTTRPDGQLDLATGLAALATARVTVSVPPTSVVLAEHTVTEVVAATRAVLDNVRVHVGSDARAWILVEELDGKVEVSVRDDGPGIPDGRLARAAEEGRLGVRQSIVGRIGSIGGVARCSSEPGLGCEWTFELPVGPR